MIGHSLKLISIWVVLWMLPFAAWCQQQTGTVKVYLLTGEYYEGQIVAITHTHILLKQQSNIQSLDREQVRYVFYNKPQPVTNTYGALQPLEKKYMAELEGAINTFNPFALKMAYTEWLRLNERWSLGAGTSFQFFRFAMLNVSFHARRYSRGEYVKFFVEGETAVSFYETVTNVNNEYFDYDFSPVTQLNGYIGLWLDTGYNLAFTFKTGVGNTWYSLTEFYSPSFRVDGSYYRGGPVFSCSMLF